MNVKNMVENFENIKDPFAELEAGLDDSKKMDHNQVGIPESKSLMDIYQDEAATIATSLYTDPQFLDLLKKVKGFTGYDSQIDLILQGKINDLSVEDRASLIGNLGNHLKFNPDKVQSPQLYQQFNALVQKKTNLYPYSFFPGAFELPATYGEKGVKDAQQNRRLAQIKYDAFHSLPNPPPPAWLKKEKEDRYYAVMGGKDGNYCKENSCGPCLIYVKSCRKQ